MLLKLCFIFKNLVLLQKEEEKTKQETVAQSLTQQRAKCGPVIDPTAYTFMYIYIYMRACREIINWARFGHFEGYCLGQVRVTIWAKFVFFAHFIVVSSDFCTFSYHFVFFAQL